jgi:hypothetical protein
MAICQSCGGVIGQDCFNPSECAWITEQQDRKAQPMEQIDNCDYALLADVRKQAGIEDRLKDFL